MDKEERIVALTMGPGSYLVNGNLEYGSTDCHVLIGRYCSLAHRLTFEIGLNHDYRQVTTYPFIDIMKKDNFNHYKNANHYQVIIGNDVWIGCNVVILGGTRIGNGAVIGAGAVVSGNVPPYAVVVGNPAKVIKYRFDKDIIDRLQKIKWWYWDIEKIKKNLALMQNPEKFVSKFYCNCLNEELENEIITKLRNFKSLKYKIYYFILDFENSYPIWKKIIEEYLGKYSSINKIILLLELPKTKYCREIAYLQKCITSKGKNSPTILIYQGNGKITDYILQNVDYFITSREDISSQCVDYSVNYNFDVISGLENDVFAMDNIINNNELIASNTMNSNKNLAQKIDMAIINEKRKIENNFLENQLENGLLKIRNMGSILYEYNQRYTDNDLENELQKIEKILSDKTLYKNIDDKRVLFYDGFGLDSRGLAQIYLQALGLAGYKIFYIVINKGRENIPTLKKILHCYNAKILYLPANNIINTYKILCKYIYLFKPRIGFLYTTPYDISAIMAFMHFKNMMKRYLINLTDHAFWLGKNSFDYCLEFRDYGASLSFKYRKILANKLIKQPYYPIFNKRLKFDGFPFEKENKDFVIFSGGFLYKTMDKNNTYYQIIDYCLKAFSHTKFWYAGYGDDSQLKILMARYPGRVFHTNERKDLFQVLQNIDMYINTYPFLGGLMTQYSAIAGKAPITLGSGKSLEGLLFNSEKLKIEFIKIEEIKEEIIKYISDEDYRYKKDYQMKNTVIDSKIFTENLVQIIECNKSKFPIHIYDIDTSQDKKIYYEQFLKKFGSDIFNS
ncbi:CatB-related O-acetyltransferase [Pectinatus sottacetonis]|uniref:CatB-related O-acetyltransferase n=1 Tax=Pectinatus sottacetonis TaxID=1002795 RepID=UPI0018C71CAD|nr:CatB-related O-acetyltransferase [Pectinatus sottacetonis]